MLPSPVSGAIAAGEVFGIQEDGKKEPLSNLVRMLMSIPGVWFTLGKP
jgi:hypothetical protein